MHSNQIITCDIDSSKHHTGKRKSKYALNYNFPCSILRNGQMSRKIIIQH